MAKVEKTLDGYFIIISEKEAIEIIKSLSTQLLNKSGNAGRVEFGNPYFTIAIEFEKESEKLFTDEDIKRSEQVLEVTKYLRKQWNLDSFSSSLQKKMIQTELNFRRTKNG